MYGTVARFSVMPRQDEAVMATLDRWRREGKPEAKGWVGDYILTSERIPGEWLVMVLFDNEENYRKNAADPEQHRQFEEVRALLRADPEWNDGAIVAIAPAAAPR
ncbi:MAG TPA: hypothetical protein VFI22_07345 [Thermomicrobiales bacterium]|nr:hypothetical protein [Thermomicrobiales bacterium]